MATGKLIVLEGIYGSGKLIVDLVEKLRTALTGLGENVYEMDSPDIGRAQLMGAEELPSSWCYGMFKPDFFFELASRARVCSVARDEMNLGKLILCKNFTISSIVYARLKGHDWFRECLNCLEASARGLQFGGEVKPDLTLFIDISPDEAIKELGERMNEYFTASDIALQRKYFIEELSQMPDKAYRILDARMHVDDVLSAALSAIHAVR